MTKVLPRPLFLELDLISEQGRALQQSVAERYGSKIADAARLASRMFLLRSPWAPGLRFVGAETGRRVLSEDGATLVPISLGGSGEELEEAFVSCVGEGIDRLAQIESSGDVVEVASLTEMTGRIWPAAATAIGQVVASRALGEDTPLAWVAGKKFDPAFSSDGGCEILLPADWCLRRVKDQTHLSPLASLSVGVAAGPTFDWAASRAVLELIERDAASLWWIGGRRGKAIPLDQPAMSDIVRLVAALRRETNDRALWMLDITTDIGVPVVAALSCDEEGRQLAYGLASRLSVKEAMRAAILELCQTELAILIAEIKRTEVGEDRLPPTDRCHVERGASIDANRCELLHPVGIRVDASEPEAEPEPSAILSALHRIGIEAALVDLTRAEFGIPVVRAVAPALQLMPSAIVTDRLRREIAASGGGARYTGGIPLIL
jgi:ribosomal protein S12 methylthiotransferase accessory factor